MAASFFFFFFFFNDTATTEIYTLSLHDALPIWACRALHRCRRNSSRCCDHRSGADACRDRKSTRLNSSHSQISYAVFCLKKKKLLIYEEFCVLETSALAHSAAYRLSPHTARAVG